MSSLSQRMWTAYSPSAVGMYSTSADPSPLSYKRFYSLISCLVNTFNRFSTFTSFLPYLAKLLKVHSSKERKEFADVKENVKIFTTFSWFFWEQKFKKFSALRSQWCEMRFFWDIFKHCAIDGGIITDVLKQLLHYCYYFHLTES